MTNGLLGQTLNSELDYIDCSVNSTANQVVEIPGAPATSLYIPIHVNHSDTGAVLENIAYDGRWRIFSNKSQKLTVRFFQRPAK